MTIANRRRPSSLPAVGSWVRILAAGALMLTAACSSSTHSAAPAPATFTVGGSISGLSANGLVLANGGATLSVASGAASFTFPSAVAAGTAYAVTVQTSPAGATCTVAMGSGTVQTANVSNIVVTCSNSSYTVGGSVTGLNGSGLVLQNGADTVTVAANATSYTLPTPVASTSTYTVGVKTQPAGLSCSVANGTGTMGAANVTNVNVSCSDQPFTLGGTVSGLTTGGLVLANGADTVAVAANATRFTLPSGVNFSAAYAVTVQTQPAGLLCSVGSGSGRMPAANVSSVTVTCSSQSFHLGGTLTGLTTGGLVLANGPDTLTVGAHATTFTLPAAVAFAAPYAVTVQTQPAGLTCTPSGATGTMPANDVTSVIVTCAANSYTLGGSISGLHGTGLVLANGTDTLAVASNAVNFTMPTGVAYGSPYAVTIHTQPRGYSCTLANDTGTMGAANVTSVTVTCTQNAVWAYSADNTHSNILLYSVDNATHLLSANPVSAYATGTNPVAVTANAQGSVLYSVNAGANTVSWFNIDAATGALAAAANVATGSATALGFTPNQLVMNAAGTFAFVPNLGSDTIAVFAVAGDGSLTAVAGSPFYVPNHANNTTVPRNVAGPSSITLHPTLPLLYVTNTYEGSIATMGIDPTTGALTPGAVILSAGNAPISMVIDSAGAYAYVANRDATRVEQFSIDNAGVLTSITSIATGVNPVSLALDPTGAFLYSANTGDLVNSVSEFSIDPATHVITPVGSAPTAASASNVLVDSTGTVYVTNSGDPTQSISAFSMDPASGALTGIGTSAGPAGAAEHGLALAKP